MTEGVGSKPTSIRKGILAILLILIFVFAAYYFVVQKRSVEIKSYEVSSVQTPFGWYFWLDGKLQFVEQVKTNESLYIVHFWKSDGSLAGRHDANMVINADMQFLVVHFTAEKMMWMKIDGSNVGGKIDLYIPSLEV
jgi:hypothetical protein